MKSHVSALIAIVALTSSIAFAASKGHKHGKGHVAHQHGFGKLNLITEGNKLTAQFEFPSESIYGFEYEPTSEADKKKREDGGEKLKASIETIIILDAKLGCKFENSKLNLHVTEDHQEAESATKPQSSNEPKTKAKKRAEHSETHAEFVAQCTSPLAGTTVNFGFTKAFPKLKRVKVQVVSGDKQTGAEILKDKGAVVL